MTVEPTPTAGAPPRGSPAAARRPFHSQAFAGPNAQAALEAEGDGVAGSLSPHPPASLLAAPERPGVHVARRSFSADAGMARPSARRGGGTTSHSGNGSDGQFPEGGADGRSPASGEGHYDRPLPGSGPLHDIRSVGRDHSTGDDGHTGSNDGHPGCLIPVAAAGVESPEAGPSAQGLGRDWQQVAAAGGSSELGSSWQLLGGGQQQSVRPELGGSWQLFQNPVFNKPYCDSLDNSIVF